MLEQIKQKIEELSRLGKERSELDLWLNMLPIMNDEEQKELLNNLEGELAIIRGS